MSSNASYPERLAEAARELARAQKVRDEFVDERRNAESNCKAAEAVVQAAWAELQKLLDEARG